MRITVKASVGGLIAAVYICKTEVDAIHSVWAEVTGEVPSGLQSLKEKNRRRDFNLMVSMRRPEDRA